ncbi:MAG: tRNA (adenosine(37)-N6)-dimethylallyltransferase MiaA [Alphaproteobacteria bacterium]|nr:tRNA (adenosine(37)-N6)-dimethylallyltransferase MiaA [Alphaproteobacteria bacterium]
MTNAVLPKIISIVGPNASGKSSAGLELAKKYNGEIISADSRQVYRGFDLCSGKVTPGERQQVPHHLLDVRDIGQPFSVADFQNQAYAAISGIIKRGKVPFIVGGTGLYVDSVVHGYVIEEEQPDDKLRARLEAKSLEELLGMLPKDVINSLKSNPSDFANKRRIIRLVEKTEKGKPLEKERRPQYRALQLGVTWPKDMLHKRIDERLAARIRQGMIGEVREYLDSGGNPGHLHDLGLEYRHILWHLTGKHGSIDEFQTEMGTAIKQFAKRQLTWFKRDENIHWLDMAGDHTGQASDLVKRFLAAP